MEKERLQEKKEQVIDVRKWPRPDKNQQQEAWRKEQKGWMIIFLKKK